MSLIQQCAVNSSLTTMDSYGYGVFQPCLPFASSFLDNKLNTLADNKTVAEKTCSATRYSFPLIHKECPVGSNLPSLFPVLTPAKHIKTLHPRELEAQNYFGKEILELDPADLRPKALYLVSSARDDTVFSFEQTKNFLDIFGFKAGAGSKPHLETLSKTHDVLYRMISSPEEMCSTITASAKTGKIKTLVLLAHGYSKGISLPDQRISSFRPETLALLNDCFSKLDEEAEISLLSCETGRYPDSIASLIAKLANRIVWAPETSVTSSGTEFSLSVPSRPTFSTFYLTKDLACKFFQKGIAFL